MGQVSTTDGDGVTDPLWYATDYPYAGGWLITVGAPWEPGHPERIIATARNGEIATRIVNDHNAMLAAAVGEAQLSLLAAGE